MIIVIIVSFKSKIPENYDAFYLAPESSKQHPRDRTLDLSSSFRYKHITSLKDQFAFGATFAALFVLFAG